jgi:hypothetical protein
MVRICSYAILSGQRWRWRADGHARILPEFVVAVDYNALAPLALAADAGAVSALTTARSLVPDAGDDEASLSRR